MVRHALDHDRVQSFSGSRQDRATPLLDEIRVKIETAQGRALPASALGKACRYAVTLWEKLTRFLESPDPELSNNLAENSMRPVALTKVS